MKYEFTEQDRLKILRLINEGDTSVVDDDCINRFFAMYAAVSKAAVAEARARNREITRLSAKLRRHEATEERLCLEGEFQGRGLDSVTVARALLYCIQQYSAYNPGVKISMQKLQILLYDVYANYLAVYRTRLTVEGPKSSGYEDKATGRIVELGPCFWRVKNALGDVIRAQTRMTADDFKALENADPDAAGICIGVARKRHSEEDRNLFLWIKNSEPFRDADRSNNGGKFGRDYSDALVYRWKKDQMAMRREVKAKTEPTDGGSQA